MCRKLLSAGFCLAALGLFSGVLGFYGTGIAAPPGPKEPFANPVTQRLEIIEQLKEMNRQLREQNALLRSGRLRVVIAKDVKK